MYSAVAPPTSITEGVTVHKGEPKDEELTAPKGRVTSAHLAALQRARAKNVTLSKQLVKEANKKEPAKAGKRKEQPKKEEPKEPKELTPENNPLEMMKYYLNPNPQLRGVPEGPLAVKSQLEEDIDKAIKDGDYDKAEALNEQLAKHKQASIILTSIECVKYSIDQRLEERLTRERKKPRLNWTFDPKANWERKGNM